MSGVTIEIEPGSLAEVRALMTAYRNSSRKAIQRSINFGAKQGQKTGVDEMAKKANLTKKTIREHTKVYPTSISALSAKVVLKGEPISLIEYKARQTAKGVSFRIWKGQPLERYRHAFIWTLIKERYTGVFEPNVDSPRFNGFGPYRRKSGPGVPTIYEKTPGLAGKVEQIAAEKMMGELKRQVGLIDRGLL